MHRPRLQGNLQSGSSRAKAHPEALSRPEPPAAARERAKVRRGCIRELINSPPPFRIVDPRTSSLNAEGIKRRQLMLCSLSLRSSSRRIPQHYPFQLCHPCRCWPIGKFHPSPERSFFICVGTCLQTSSSRNAFMSSRASIFRRQLSGRVRTWGQKCKRLHPSGSRRTRRVEWCEALPMVTAVSGRRKAGRHLSTKSFVSNILKNHSRLQCRLIQ